MPFTPASQPGMTCPWPSWNGNGFPRSHELSNTELSRYSEPTYCTVTVSPGLAALPLPLCRSLMTSLPGGVGLSGVTLIFGLVPSAPVTATLPGGGSVGVAVGWAAVSSLFLPPPQAVRASAASSTGRMRRCRRIAVRKRSRGSAIRTEDPVAGVAQAGADVAGGVQLAVDHRRGDRDVRMGGAQRLHALGGGDQADEVQPLRARALEPGDRLRPAAAGGQHRIHHEHLGVFHAGGDVLVVAHWPQRLLVAVHAEVAHARLRHEPQEPVHQAEPGPQDRHDEHLVSQPQAGGLLQRRLQADLRRAQAAHRFVAEDQRGVRHRLAEHAVRRLPVAQDRQQAPEQHVVDDRDPIHGAERTRVASMAAPRRNIELKAFDPDPERSLAAALGLGARDKGVIRQRDTYFRVVSGRLKLREEEPGGASLVQYSRADAASARESRYRVVPVEDAAGLCAALETSLGVLAVVEKERHLLLWQNVRIHLDRVHNLGNFLELEGVATADSDLAVELDRVTRLTEALDVVPERILRSSYSDQVIGSDALVAAARAVMGSAHAPYSGFHVGVALRADDGSIHVGANVENAAYPQGQCAEASAIGALVAAGRTRITEVAVISDGEAACVPCGGCRQRLREFMDLTAEIHMCSLAGARESATLAALLPRSFGPEFLPA